MADQHIQARLVARNDTAEHWTAQNPVLLQGEMGVETDTGKFKFGDGSAPWNDLSYVLESGSGGLGFKDVIFTEAISNGGGS